MTNRTTHYDAPVRNPHSAPHGHGLTPRIARLVIGLTRRKADLASGPPENRAPIRLDDWDLPPPLPILLLPPGSSGWWVLPPLSIIIEPDVVALQVAHVATESVDPG